MKLAQTGVSQSLEAKHECNTAHERNKKELSELIDVDDQGKFTDADFRVGDALYWADYASERNGPITAYNDMIVWKRASEQFSENPFWGTDGVSPSDVI